MYLDDMFFLFLKYYILKTFHSLTLCSTHVGFICLAVIQGAGGMQMIDPLFQRVLVKECQYRKIPVIFDEVFTGFWRLGAEVGFLL